VLVLRHIGGEDVIETAIFAHDDNDVLDRRDGLDVVNATIRIGATLSQGVSAKNR
jgi:hypothetical protein